MSTLTEVRIAGVPWPLYKVVSLVVFALVFVVVGVVTISAAAAVLSAAAAATAVWIGLGVLPRGRLALVDHRRRSGERMPV